MTWSSLRLRTFSRLTVGRRIVAPRAQLESHPCRPFSSAKFPDNGLGATLRRSEDTSDDTSDDTSQDTATSTEENPIDPSAGRLGRILRDDFAKFKEHYSIPKHPVVLAHGLMGFDELRFASAYLPPIHYWRGIKDAFRANGIEVISTAVPTTGSIAHRAEALHAQIAQKLRGRNVNIIAHSMGGLDARYLISRLCPAPSEYSVASLTTIASPHRGSSAADMLFRDIGDENIPRLYKLLSRMKISTDAFSQLTTTYIKDHFNPATPNSPSVQYFSYGASATPHILSVFRLSHDLMEVIEGPNDGLVSVKSSKWGNYQGTLMGVTHLDLINWTNRIKQMAGKVGMIRVDFDAVAFYLGVSDMLAREGL